MSPPLSMTYWDALRSLADPVDLMKFTLIYDNDLPAGNSSRPTYASRIRNEFHEQLTDLWMSNVILRQLARTARTAPLHFSPLGRGSTSFSPIELPQYSDPPPPLLEGQTDLCGVINKTNVGAFIPLVRHSLYLRCRVDILFLRHDEPFVLLKKGGDIDNRLKTLFDGLRMPDSAEELGGEVLRDDPLYVVLEDDALINEFSVKTGKLLGAGHKRPHRVRLTVDITVTVFRVFEQNLCLLGE